MTNFDFDPRLASYVNRGDTVYTIVRSVARSGMSRVMSFYVVHDGDMVCIDSLMADIGVGRRVTNGAGVRVTGGGMDMAFWATYELSSALFDGGYMLGYRVL